MSTLIKRNASFPTMNSFFSDFFGNDFLDWNPSGFLPNGSTLPSVNLKETEKGFEVELAAPGLQKDDFIIEVHNQILTISSEKKEEKEEKDEKGNYTRREFNYSSFRRSFTLPESVNTENINATYENGVLRLTLPKKEEALPKPKRLIEIA